LKDFLKWMEINNNNFNYSNTKEKLNIELINCKFIFIIKF